MTTTTPSPILSPDAALDALVTLSRAVGADPTMVLAGGGNTSVKVGRTLFVKASGSALASISADGFVALDRDQLDTLAAADLGSDPQRREEQFKRAVLTARREPERNQRPSVESLLHHLIPGTFVVHSHATTSNALTCCVNGEAIARELFGDEVLWLPYVDPGFTLAQLLVGKLRARSSPPRAILMANHGLIVAGDSAEEVQASTRWLLDAITRKLGGDWNTELFGTPQPRGDAAALINLIAPALRGLLADGPSFKIVTVDDGPVAASLVSNADDLRALVDGGPMTPDQIVYCNSYPLWLDAASLNAAEPAAAVDHLRTAVESHRRRTGYDPKVVLVRGVALFAIGDDFAAADTTRRLYLDAATVMAGARRLGGVSYLTTRQRKFIEDWEVEAYRKQVAAGARTGGRAAGKVVVVTGAAQGFGLEIAQGVAVHGAHVALTDLNEQGASSAATGVAAQVGRGRAVGLPVNVTDGASIAACLHRVVREFGGVDVFISNAGVLKAGSVKTQPERDFAFVTDVNYKGYFLCVQNAAPIFAIQHLAKPDAWFDVIQINSKSGLQGSNRNGAYAGSKFGGIGLTQSFALELVEDHVKVNSICPGNFFDGPLWSHPETGLFVQYLRTGKVPGATSIEDVKRFYEAKVPMGRGCASADVLRAILYLIEQVYETGQALPVTGGQVMLS